MFQDRGAREADLVNEIRKEFDDCADFLGLEFESVKNCTIALPSGETLDWSMNLVRRGHYVPVTDLPELNKERERVDVILDIDGLGGKLIAMDENQAWGYLTGMIWPLLSNQGVYYLYPVRKNDLESLRQSLSDICRRDGEVFVGKSGDDENYLVAIGKGVVPVVDGKFESVNFLPQFVYATKTQLSKVKSMGSRDFIFIAGKDIDRGEWISDGFIAMQQCRYGLRPSTKLSPDLTLCRGDKFLWWSHLNFDKGSKGFVHSLRLTQAHLRNCPETKCILTLTWLSDFVEKMGFQKSEIPVSRQAVEMDLAAINAQLIELWSIGGSLFSDNLLKGVSAEDVINNLAWWYCKPGDFRIPTGKRS